MPILTRNQWVVGERERGGGGGREEGREREGGREGGRVYRINFPFSLQVVIGGSVLDFIAKITTPEIKVGHVTVI